MTNVADFKPVVPWLEPGAHIGACVLLQDSDDRVLMQLRDDVPGILAPGKWCLFGGHVDPGEEPLEAAVRELKEETGLNVEPDALIPYVRTRSRPSSNLLFIFRAKLDLKPADICVGEGAGFGFFTRDQVDRLDLIPAFRPVFHHFWYEDFQAVQ